MGDVVTHDEDAEYEEKLAEQRDEELEYERRMEDVLDEDHLCAAAGHPYDGNGTCFCGEVRY